MGGGFSSHRVFFCWAVRFLIRFWTIASFVDELSHVSLFCPALIQRLFIASSLSSTRLSWEA